ncbi:MAG: ATP-dependent RNA helicase HrpA, partial [Actinobacteria bacterium]|nr:ATP-dependent RNA helicase HrpA [Actinomycetota bacterium]
MGRASCGRWSASTSTPSTCPSPAWRPPWPTATSWSSTWAPPPPTPRSWPRAAGRPPRWPAPPAWTSGRWPAPGAWYPTACGPRSWAASPVPPPHRGSATTTTSRSGWSIGSSARRGPRRWPTACGASTPPTPPSCGAETVEDQAVTSRDPVPPSSISYPDELPITARRQDLLEAISANQVVVVAGETGSGKSTQLPKLCLELGRGVVGRIGHTQPRRVAARAIAERVAEELGTELGGTVGYAVRFTDRVGPATHVKVMTDGILLAELQRDRTLSAYDTIIVDEAHERSLNIDFLLGYLKQLLPRRPDLKVIITSATIDTARFSEHFEGAPVISVSGRTFPVEVRYRPFGETLADPDGGDGDGADDRIEDDRDQVQAVCDAIDELGREGPGDVLVFLSGEREIRDTADALAKLDRRDTEVLPLYARLSAAEQHRIFQPHRGRRIVLATNVAETSLTVPGIRYVVDAGLARISRYSHRLKVQRLPIEPVSQASADQRAGRCGRVAPGICIRLYREDDYDARTEFTDPEILRTNLASVILQMTNLGLGDVEAFPFLDPPDLRAIRDGVALLEELGALELDRPADRRRLTRLGRKLVNLPVDPRMARMVVQADREGSVHEVLVIAAALSIQDPRERPTEHRQEADELHRRFDVAGSDFLALVRLWDHLAERQRELSSNRFRKLCRAEHLNYLRVREWQDLHRQLRQAAKRAGIVASTAAATPDQVHRALLAGLLSHLGMRDKDGREYQGARGARFALVPSSPLARKPPAWVMAAELVETNRLWGRMAASVQPEWAEDLAGHLVKRSYGEPRWDERSGRAVASERVTLYGLPVVANRTVGLGAVDSELARELFIEHALVRGEWSTRHRFRADNARCIEEVRELGDKLRRWDLADHDAVFAFYDRVLGSDVVSGRHFDTWWKQVRRTEPDLLTMTAADLVGDDAGTDADAFPDEWRQGDLVLPVSYRFEPGEVGDGVIVHIPLAVLNRVDAHGFDWQVPGFREELVAAILRTLPKRLRRSLTPLADAAHELARSLVVVDRPLVDVVAEAVGARLGERVSAADVDLREVPSHLRVTFAIEDGDEVMAIGKDLEAVRDLVGGRVRAAIADAAPDIERSGIERWDFGDLPTVVETTVHGHVVRGYPALLDDGDSVSIKVFSTPEIQARIMATGVRRLLLRSVPVGVKGLAKGVPNEVALAVGAVPGLSLGGLLRDAITAAADRVIAAHGGPPWDRAGFEALLEAARADLRSTTADALRDAGHVLVVAARVAARLDQLTADALAPAVADARAQLGRLVRPGFVASAGTARLGDVARYVRGIERRLEKLPEAPGKDHRRMVE